MAYSSSSVEAFGTEDDKIVVEAHKRFEYCEQWEAQARVNFEYDYKFANGDSVNMFQWDDWVVGDRMINERPCLTINKTMQHNLQIVNDGKQNKPGVKIAPVGDTASYEAAQIYMEICRHIEYVSNAENIYDSAMEFAVNGGFGYWRVTTEYVTDRSFDQDIIIKRVKDPRSVYLDPDINEIDGSDANFGFIVTNKPKDLYDAEYPEFKDVGGSDSFAGYTSSWINREHIRVAEYYRKINKKDHYIKFTLPETQEEIEAYLSELDAEAKSYFKNLKASEKQLPYDQRSYMEREVIRGDIEWFKIAGNTIIDRGTWLGKYIPIVRVIGRETIIDGILDRVSHTRALLDPQRIYNVNSPLALSTVIPTPDGWTTMRNINIGDKVLNEDGVPVEVVGVSPIFINRDCYKVIFDNDTFIIADADHLWTTEEREKIKTYNWTWPVKTVATKDLVPNKHFIYATKPLELNDKKLPIDPYVLGVWLGDGDSACNRITSGKDDVEETRNNLDWRNYKIGEARPNNYGAFSFTIHGLRAPLIETGLMNNKHIPKEYLRASKDQRLALLQGLMDTDGCYSARYNRCIFTNVNQTLINDVCELIRSLGLRFVRQDVAATKRLFPSGQTYDCQPSTHISFTVDPTMPVFKLQRKAKLQTKDRVVHERRSKRHKIISVEKVASVPVRCITVDTPSHLFLAGEGMIPTHNSANVEYGALQSKSPITAPMSAIEGFEEYYKTANSVNHSFLPYNNYDEDGNKLDRPERMSPPQPGLAYVEQMKIAQNEMMMVSGQYQAQMGENENAKSGVAINARQRQGDRATYHWIDGLSIATRLTGKILIDLIPKVYTSKRIMQIEAKDGSIINLTIDPEAQQAFQKLLPDGEQPTQSDPSIINIIFNPNVGHYAVQADNGPNYATRRQEAFNALTQIAAQNKEFMGIAGDILWRVADFPEAQLLAQRWRRVIPPNITGDAPNPQLTEAMQQASAKMEQQLAIIAKQQQELADKSREFDIKESQLDLEKKKVAVEQQRLDYEAETKRVVALGNSGPAISVEQIQPVLRQLLAGMIENGELVYDAAAIGQGGTPIQPEPDASLEPSLQQPMEQSGAPQPQSVGNPSDENEPPVEGAMKAPDNNWYVENPEGGHLMVEHG